MGGLSCEDWPNWLATRAGLTSKLYTLTTQSMWLVWMGVVFGFLQGGGRLTVAPSL